MKLEDRLLTTGKAVVAFTHWLDKAKGLSVIKQLILYTIVQISLNDF